MGENVIFSIGQRVQTPLGVGTVAGFEEFNIKGWPISPSRVDRGYGRVTVRLGEPDAWHLMSEKTPDPYCYRNELFVLKE